MDRSVCSVRTAIALGSVPQVVDGAHLEPRRERAIAMHRSQVAPFDGMPIELRSAFLRTDRLVRLQPAWTESEPERELF
jgi:hypothetical protein